MSVIRRMVVVSTLVVALVGAACTTATASPTVAGSAGSTVWLCKPGQQPDPCAGDQSTTVVGVGGTRTAVTPPTTNAPIDCFYVYPTVSTELSRNADLRVTPELTTVAEQQASRFSQVCNVYAPVYRQSTLAGLATSPGPARSAALDEAYDDIESAWSDYLSHYNAGRGVVFLGHSQGSSLLRALLRNRIDPDPAARAKLVSAVLLGGNVLVPKGKVVGGDFASIPGCTSDSQTGCVLAYSTFSSTPPDNTRFGVSPSIPDANGTRGHLPYGPDYQVLCTNPASLGANDRAPIQPEVRGAILGTVASGSIPLPGTTWVDPAPGYNAQCQDLGGATVLHIDGGNSGAIPSLPSKDWGLHLFDMSIALGNLVGIVAKQAKAFMEQ